MGLDQAVIAIPDTSIVKERGPFLIKREVYNWAGHASLQAWMTRLWQRGGRDPEDFNLEYFEIKKEDIDDLWKNIESGSLYRLEWHSEKTFDCKDRRTDDFVFCIMANRLLADGKCHLYYWCSW